MDSLQCDVAVIGAGTAGLAAERAARAAGATTLLIDPAFAGTTCATVGCMPSKLLIAAADAAHAVRAAATFGITAEPRIDGAAVMERVRRLRDHFAAATRHSIDGMPEEIRIRARARFTGPTSLALDDGRSVEAHSIVIATGAAPVIPKPYRDFDVLTNETVFELPNLPPSLGVIGAGPEGLELAQAMHRLGVRVHVFDPGRTIAGLGDEAVSECLAGILGADFDLHLSTEVTPHEAEDGVELRWDGGTVTVDRLLVTAGRAPLLDGLNLAASGLKLDGHGTPVFDPESLQCGDAPVFIAGDANHDRAVLHEAGNEGTIAGDNAARFPEVRGRDRGPVLAIAFTRPEAATIGAGSGALTAEASYSDQGRARVEGRNEGMVRLFAKADGTLTGAALCLPDGEHLAQLLAWAVASGFKADRMLEFPLYHPTLEEGLSGPLQEICKAAGLPRPWYRDESRRPGG